MIVVSWNCRSLGTTFKINAARDILVNEKPDIYMIQETKTSKQENQKLIQKLRNYEGTVLEATEASGGICTIWDKRKWELINQKISNHWIKTDLRDLNTKALYGIMNVYSPNHYREKEHCWNSIKEELAERQKGKLILRRLKSDKEH